MLLSINLNKIALLRNSRGSNYPKLESFALKALDMGAEGITLHPRPDHRHATSNDVINLSKIVKDYGAEFNIEGNPFEEKTGDYLGFTELIKICEPTQATLVPDTLDQITSDHGWTSGSHDQNLIRTIKLLKSYANRVSLFIDPTTEGVDYAHSMGADSIELYTENYAKTFKKIDSSLLIETYKQTIIQAKSLGLRVNAGHDLNLENLPALKTLNLIDEVSIGHAIIVDALNYGFEDTIKRYIQITKG